MGEWRPYHHIEHEKAAADGALEVKGEEVEAGEILEVRVLSVKGTNHGEGEYLYLGYHDRAEKCYIQHAVNTASTKVVTTFKGFLRLTEGMYPLAYLEAANKDEDVVLVVNGRKYIPSA